MAAENFKVKRGLEVGTGSTITSGGVNITGIITAVQFKGDGSGLTGVVGSGSGVVIKDEGSTVGTAGTINFVGSDVSTAISEGTATVTVGVSTANVVTDTLSVVGVTTISDHLYIKSPLPRIYLTDTNHDSDWYIGNSDGTIVFYDETTTNTRFEINPGGSRPFIRTPFNTDSIFRGETTIGGHAASPSHSLTVAGISTFNGNINVNADLNVTGTITGSLAASVVKQVREAASTGQSGTGQSYTDKVTLTMTVQNNSRVLIISSYELESSTPFGSGNNTMAKTIKVGGSFVGEEVVNTHNGYYSYSGSKKYDIFYDTDNGAGSRSYKIQWKRLTNGTGYIKNARLLGIELGIGP